jgi:DNA-binding response OmpR family regulator
MTRILSLDDESQMLDLLRLILERAGYECLGTTDEQEALSILRTQPVDLFSKRKWNERTLSIVL